MNTIERDRGKKRGRTTFTFAVSLLPADGTTKNGVRPPKLYIFYGPWSTEGVRVYSASMAAWVGAWVTR